MMKIAVLVGSLRADSINKKLAKNVEALAPEGVEFVYADLNLPLFNQDLEADLPQDVRALKSLINEADGVLFVTPEHNRTIPAVLKNGIEWASRPYGDNSFEGKPATVIGASGAMGASQAQHTLRSVAAHLNTRLMGQPEVYFNAYEGLDEQGVVVEKSRDFLADFIKSFVEHINTSK
jgi:chromate reductase